MREMFANWQLLFFHYLKRDLIKIIIWILALGLFSAGFLPAFKEIAKGEGFIGMFETLQNPAMTAMLGPTPIEDASYYSLGAMYAHEMLLFCGLFTLIVSLLHVINHTRKEEELGLTELIRSFQLGRQANSFAIYIQVLLINLILSLFIALVMMSFNADSITVEGSLLFGISIGIAGLLGASIGLLLAQIMPTSSSATGTSLGIIGLLYLMRAITDVSNLSLSLFNPMAWIYLPYPFTENNWLPIIIALLFSLVLCIVALLLEGNRDLGASYIKERQGREHAKKSLLSVGGLFLNLNKTSIISWFVAFLVMGLAYGSIYGDMQSFVEGNDLMQMMFTYAGFSLEQSFTATLMDVMISLVAILPIAIINRVYTEENRSHLSQVFSTKVSRARLYWTNISIAVGASLIGILLASGGLASAALFVMTDDATIGMTDFFLTGYNLFPLVLFMTGLAALLLGWKPQVGRFVYIYLVYSFLLSYFSNILNLPAWFFKTAIQTWLPQIPMEDFSLASFLVVLVISSFLILLGYLGYSKRDMIEE